MNDSRYGNRCWHITFLTTQGATHLQLAHQSGLESFSSSWSESVSILMCSQKLTFLEQFQEAVKKAPPPLTTYLKFTQPCRGTVLCSSLASCTFCGWAVPPCAFCSTGKAPKLRHTRDHIFPLRRLLPCLPDVVLVLTSNCFQVETHSLFIPCRHTLPGGFLEQL